MAVLSSCGIGMKLHVGSFWPVEKLICVNAIVVKCLLARASVILVPSGHGVDNKLLLWNMSDLSLSEDIKAILMHVDKSASVSTYNFIYFHASLHSSCLLQGTL